METYLYQDISSEVISAAIEVHKNLGPGLLEVVYRSCLALELESRGTSFRQEVIIPLTYKNTLVDHSFRLDFLVEQEVVVELKSVERVLPVHEAQLVTYLRLSRKRVGLLINFNVPVLRLGIHRRVLEAGGR